MSSKDGRSAQEIVAGMQSYGAKKGIIYALASGVFWGLAAFLLTLIFTWVDANGTSSLGLTDELIGSVPYIVTIALIFAMLHDLSAGIFMVFFCGVNGKIKEYLRTMRTKPGWVIVLAAVFGGPVAMSGYMLGLFMAGPYAVAITTCFPALGAILGAIFLKEKINARVWFGIVLVLVGSVIISWTPPEEGVQYPYFYWGIALGCFAALGWAIEGVLGTLGMDLVDSDLALGIRELSSGIMYALFVMPILYLMFSHIIFDGSGGLAIGISGLVILATFGVGCVGAIGYLTYFKGLNRTGVARGQALHVNYGIWLIIFAWLIGGDTPAANLWIGAVVAIIGIVFIVGSPKELFSLRNT